MTMSLKTEVQDLVEQMRALALKAAARQGSLRLKTHYADNYWTVTLHGDGRTSYDGYAEESRGPTGTVSQLTMWELSLLLQDVK